MSGQMKMFRSLLFVPGTRPERFDKAIGAGADAVCIDLEDAVPPEDKDRARDLVCAYVANRGDSACAMGVRINGLETEAGRQDVQAIKQLSKLPDFIMVPKAQNAFELETLREEIGVPVWAVVETIKGLHRAEAIALACSGGGLLFGGADFSLEMGVSMDWEPLLYARGKLVVDAKGAMVQMMDVPFLDVNDPDGLRLECERVKALGFSGKACIHPNQVAIINEVFSPTDSEIAWAKRVIQAGLAADGNAILLDGKLLDAPVYLRAQRILEGITH
jgi:citrate lyase beta subunit